MDNSAKTSVIYLIAVIIGCVGGILLRRIWSSDDYIKMHYLQFPGRILINMLQLVSLPLTLSSIVTAVTSVGSKPSGKLFLVMVLYFLITTVIASMIGIVYSMIATSRLQSYNQMESNGHPIQEIELLANFLSQCFPQNIVTACFETIYVQFIKEPCINKTEPQTSCNTDQNKEVIHPEANYLGLIIVSLTIGYVINKMTTDLISLKAIIFSLHSVISLSSQAIMWYAPIGIIFLNAFMVASVADIRTTLRGLDRFIFTVVGGLAIHGFVILPVIYALMTRKNPFKFAFEMMKSLSTAWSTTSSTTTIAITIDSLIRSGVDKNIANIVATTGAILNNNGSALYQAVVCINIAITNKVTLYFDNMVAISVLLTVVVICTSAMSNSRPATLFITLTAMGLPVQDTNKIISVDWLLSHFRSVVDVWGDCLCAGMLDYYFKDLFAKRFIKFDFTEADFDIEDSSDSSSDLSSSDDNKSNTTESVNERKDAKSTAKPPTSTVTATEVK